MRLNAKWKSMYLNNIVQAFAVSILFCLVAKVFPKRKQYAEMPAEKQDDFAISRRSSLSEMMLYSSRWVEKKLGSTPA